MVLKSLCGLTVDELYDLIRPYDYNYSDALSVLNNIYKKRIKNISDFIKVPKKLKDTIAASSWSGISDPISSVVSDDKTVKYLFKSNSGIQFEAVYIPDGRRHTVCVSTQSGCRMGCPFCLSGRFGFHGNLTAGEIVSQILSIQNSKKITHVVFMGMGEPMDNLENVLKACEILTAQWGLALSPRHVTISTVGIKPGIERLLEESDCNLTLSLHSPFSNERKLVVPAERKYPAGDILQIMKNFRLKKGRRFSVAYVMISGLNDTETHLNELISMLKDSVIRVNLLPYHSVGDDSMNSSSPEKMQYFKHNLIISGISASVRKSRGSDISAACGLLAAGMVPNANHGCLSD
jgi:23S rRNA (adenine2503-C2)-methyltransferase